MLSWRRPSYSRIGLDIGSRQIKAVQLVRYGTQRALHAAAVVERRHLDRLDDVDVARLSHALESQNFHGTEVALTCPPSAVHMDVLELPPRSSGAPLDQIARMEMQRSSRFETPFEMSYWDLPAAARMGVATNVMAAAVKRSDAEGLMSSLYKAGLDVAAIDTHPTALARIFSHGGPEDIAAVADAGASTSTLVLVHRGNVIYQRRLSEVSLNMLHRTLNDEMQIGEKEQDYLLRQIGLTDPADCKREPFAQERRFQAMLAQYADALAEEIEASLSYAAHRYPQLRPTRAAIVGGGGNIAGIDRYVGRRVAIDVHASRPAEVVTCSPGREAHAMSAALMPAIGLAMNESD